MKVSNTRPVGLTIKVLHIKIVLFFDHWSNHLFQSNQRFQVIEFMDQPVPEALDIFRSFPFYAWLLLYPQFPWYLLRMPEDHNPILHTHTNTNMTNKKKCLQFKSLAAKASKTITRKIPVSRIDVNTLFHLTHIFYEW